MATFLTSRFVAATVLLWGLLLATGRFSRLPARTVAVEIGLGAVYGIMSVTYFESLAWLSAGVAALLLFTYPVQVTVVSSLALDEPITLPKLSALLATTAGVALVVLGDRIVIALAGVALVGVASLCYTVYTMGTREMVAGIDPLVHVSYVFPGVTATVAGYGLATRSLAVPGGSTAWLLIAGITVFGAVLPILLFTEGLTRIRASRASIVSTSEPLTTVLLGVAFLGEVLTVSIGIGALLIIFGVVLTEPSVERAIRRRLEGVGVGVAAERDT
jgi:drug/metabolite transporter (DMT)-like permease